MLFDDGPGSRPSESTAPKKKSTVAKLAKIFGITFGVVTVVLFVLAGAGAPDAVAMPVAFAWLLTLPLAVFFGIARLIEKLRSK